MSKQKSPEIPQYKLDQMRTRQLLRRGRFLVYGETANFGIRKFKKEHKGSSHLIKTFKENVWASMARKQP